MELGHRVTSVPPGIGRRSVLRSAGASLALCCCASLSAAGQVRVTRPAARLATLSASLLRYRSNELQSVASLVVLGDGKCLVLDPTTASIGVFDQKGRYVKRVGRKGAGPGEFAEPVAMAAARDGRLFVWDPGNKRLTIFAAGLKPGPQTRYLQAFASDGSGDLWFNVDGTVSVAVRVIRSGARPNPELPNFGFATAVLRLTGTGVPIDTTWLPIPAKSEYVSAARGRVRRTYPIPFAARPRAVWNPGGFLVRSDGNRYVLQLSRVPAMTIEVEDDPVLVSPQERSDWAASLTAFMRVADPFWSWPAKAIPARKAPVVNLWSSPDGRIWVRVPQAAKRIGSVTIPQKADRIVAFDNWREPQAYDVFEPTGSHLGRLLLPDAVTANPLYARGDTVWLLSHDQDDLPVISKHAIRWPR